MQKVFVLYKLRPGVTREGYDKWSREFDQQIVPRQRGVIRFESYSIEAADAGIGTGGEPLFTHVDDIEVDDWDTWQETLQGEEMQRVVKEWLEWADESSIHIIYGDRIAPGVPPA